jgi:hypothetical protein
MTEHPTRYRTTQECAERGKLYTECLRLLEQINRGPYYMKGLRGARNALQMYAGYKAGRAHHTHCSPNVSAPPTSGEQSLTNKQGESSHAHF